MIMNQLITTVATLLSLTSRRHFSSNRVTVKTYSNQPPWIYLTYAGGPGEEHTADSQFAPTKSYCLLLVMSPAPPLPGRASGGVGKNVEISRTLWQRANSTLNWPIGWRPNPNRCWMHAPTIADGAKTKCTTPHIDREKARTGKYRQT